MFFMNVSFFDSLNCNKFSNNKFVLKCVEIVGIVFDWL